MIPIKTASNMCKWTGQQIRKNPCIIPLKEVKLSIPRVVFPHHAQHINNNKRKTKNENSLTSKTYKNYN